MLGTLPRGVSIGSVAIDMPTVIHWLCSLSNYNITSENVGFFCKEVERVCSDSILSLIHDALLNKACMEYDPSNIVFMSNYSIHKTKFKLDIYYDNWLYNECNRMAYYDYIYSSILAEFDFDSDKDGLVEIIVSVLETLDVVLNKVLFSMLSELLTIVNEENELIDGFEMTMVTYINNNILFIRFE